MADQTTPLDMLASGWRGANERLTAALAPLTAEQLALPLAPGQWSLGAVTQHIVADRVWWFHGWLGAGSADLAAQSAAWESLPAPPPARELVAALDATVQMIADALPTFTPAALAAAPEQPRDLTDGERRVFGDWTRARIIWHVLEHELRHVGEIALALGTHGLSPMRNL
jgi:uncharacterized damage-inducible protein DinB